MILKSKVIFIDMNPANVIIPIYQLGICFLAGIAYEKKWEFQIIEFADLYNNGVEYYYDILDTANIIAISIRNIDNTEGNSPISYIKVFEKIMISLAEKYAYKIVLGGAGFSILPNHILSLFHLKYGIVGRGGKIFHKLLEHIDNGNCIDEYFYDSVLCEYSGYVYYYEKLQNIWNILPYIKDDNKELGFDTHIGCNGNCIYCTYPGITRKNKCKREIREIRNFVKEAENRGIKKLQIVDDVFNGDLNFAKEVCAGIGQIRKNITISCYLSPNIDEEFVSLMKKAGISEVVMGIDSLSDDVLLKMNKGFTEKEIMRARTLLNNEGIGVTYTLIVGSLFETEKTLADTHKNLIKHLPDRVTMQYGIRVYPGTPLFSKINMDDSELLFPRFLFSDSVTRDKFDQFSSEIKKIIAERKML